MEVGNASKTVIVRDTKDRDGAVLRFGADAWRASAGFGYPFAMSGGIARLNLTGICVIPVFK